MKIIHKASPFWSATRLDVTFYNFVENIMEHGMKYSHTSSFMVNRMGFVLTYNSYSF